MSNTNPAFNLKVVLKETGLAADTLRAWERRYGLPSPGRSAGGHRLYSKRDIETIKWLMERQVEGLSISRAVELWNEQSDAGTNMLADTGVTPQSTPLLPAEASFDTLRAKWIAACLKFDETVAEQSIHQAFSIFPVEAVCTEVLQKGLAEIGELWYQNRASVQQEHFASGQAMRRLENLLSASPTPWRPQTVLMGCPENEWHAFIPLLLSLLLRRRGLNVIHLGANVPTGQLADTALAIHADLIILTAQRLVTAATLQQAALALSSRGWRAAFGGRIFNEHAAIINSIPAHFLGQNLAAAPEEVERLLQNKRKNPLARTIPAEYRAAQQFFNAKRPEIELTLQKHVKPLSIDPGNLKTGIIHLGDNIAAALQLGDMNTLPAEMEWLKRLMRAHAQPLQELASFMEIYARAVKQHLNGSGRPIYEWLSSEADKLQASRRKI